MKKYSLVLILIGIILMVSGCGNTNDENNIFAIRETGVNFMNHHIRLGMSVHQIEMIGFEEVIAGGVFYSLDDYYLRLSRDDNNQATGLMIQRANPSNSTTAVAGMNFGVTTMTEIIERFGEPDRKEHLETRGIPISLLWEDEIGEIRLMIHTSTETLMGVEFYR
jgi:hypothetical protein